MKISYTAQERDAGRTVSSILRNELRLSVSLIRRLKQTCAITMSLHVVFTNQVIVPGQTLTVEVDSGEPLCDFPPERGELAVLYESAGLIAVNKPSGQLTHPSHARYTGTLANYVAGYLKERGEPVRCHAVNRLDRDTSGVVLFAKNGYSKTLAIKALEHGEKEYLALVCGAVQPPGGVIDLPIRRVREGDMLRAVLPDGQRAVTRYVTLGVSEFPDGAASLLRLTLETGRTHQIRVHLHALGHPVLGDGLYYTAESRALSERLGIETQALHAHRLAFREPISGDELALVAAPPDWTKPLI